MSDGFLELLRQTTGIWWPAADEDRLREAATAHRRMADAIDQTTGAPSAAARSLAANNHGPAIDSFGQHWARYDAGHGTGWLADAARGYRQLADGLDEYAAAVSDAKSKVIVELEILAAALIAGAALAVFTAGASQAAAAAASVAAIAAAQAVGVTLSALVADVIAVVLIGAVAGTLEAVTVNAVVVQPAHMAFADQQGFNWNELGDWASGGAVGGGFAGGLTSGLRTASNLAEGAGRMRLATTLDTASTSLTGQALTGAAGNAATAAAIDGRVTLADLTMGAVGGMAGAAPGTGLGRPGGWGWRNRSPGPPGAPTPTAPVTEKLVQPQYDLLFAAREYSEPTLIGSERGHNDEVYEVRFGDGTRGVYRPVAGETRYDDTGPYPPSDPDLRPEVRYRAFPPEGSVGRDVATYRADQAFGYDLVPPTVAWDGPHGPGSLQRYAENCTESLPVQDYHRLDQQRMAVLDYVTGQHDRHQYNNGTTPDGRPVGWDHKDSHPATNEVTLRSRFVHAWLGEPLDPKVVDPLRAIPPEQYAAMLRQDGISEDAIRLEVSRLTEVQGGTITGEAWGGQIDR